MSEEEFDAAAAAARATGEEPKEPTVVDDHAAAEGTEPSDDVGSSSTLRDMLMNTEPATPLEEVEDPYNPELGGTTRIYRGIQKLVDVDGLPAIADIVLGALEWSQSLNLDKVGGGDQEGSNDDQEAAEEALI